MLSFKIVHDPRYSTVRLRVVQHRKKAEFSLGFKMSEEDFNDAMSFRPKPANRRWQRVFNLLSNKLAAVRMDIVQQGGRAMPLEELKPIVERALKSSWDIMEEERQRTLFTPFFEGRMKKIKTPAHYNTYKYTLDKIGMFEKSKGRDVRYLTFDNITFSWLTEFNEWLLDECQLKCNSCNIIFRNIRTVLNRAIDLELTTHYPFRRFKIKAESTRKRSLSLDDLRKLFTCEVEPYQVFYRDMFKLIFMLVGINCVDLYHLKSITADGRIEYKRSKTKKFYSIKVEPEALEIIEKYRGKKGLLSVADRWESHLDFTKNTNLALKKIGICKTGGRGGKKTITPFWPDISTYWARHTWATIARRIGVSKDDIAFALGHSTGHKVTDIYIDEDREAIDRANRKVLDWVLYGEKTQEDSSE